MALDQLLLFLTVTLFVSASPGPVMLSAMANGGIYGVRHALWGMAGATAGNLLLIVLSSAGLALVLKNSPLLFNTLQWLGAAYLIWLGIKLGLQPANENSATDIFPKAAGAQLFFKSFGIAISNPKGLIYFGALFPQFIAMERPLAPQLALLVSLFVVMDFIWMMAYAKGGSFIVGWMRSPSHRRWFNGVAGGALVIAGIALLFFAQA